MFQNLFQSSRSTSRMPVSLSEWRVRIGTYVPRMLQYHNLVRNLKQLLFLALLQTLADGESNEGQSEKQEMNSTSEHQSSTDKTSPRPEKDDSSNAQETANQENTKDVPCKTPKKRRRQRQKQSDVFSSKSLMSFRCFMKSGASPLLRFMLLVFTAILLVRSGDVEVNPGPKQSKVPDGTLLAIADRIPQDKLYVLGTKLGVDLSSVKRYYAENRMDGTLNCNGTTNMLIDWREKTTMEQQEVLLNNALNECSLQAIAEEYFREASRASSSPGPSLKRSASGTSIQSSQASFNSTSSSSSVPLTMPGMPSLSESTTISRNPSVLSTNCDNSIPEAQLDKCITDIKEFYRVNLCHIPTSPLDLNSIVELKSIFTDLYLLKKDRNTKEEIPMKYEHLLNVDINGRPAKRIMIQGEAGVGKTTFCAKIAWDYSEGNLYQDFTLVAVVPLRDAKNGKTVGQVLKTYLSDNNNVTSEQLDEYIKTNQEKVLTVFDGFDEFVVEMSHGENEIVQILQGERHKSGRVIVTTRLWKAHEITNGMNLQKQYSFVRIKGFKRKDVNTYVKKFYGNDTNSACSLLDFMKKDSLVTETMAPFPIFCSMLCHMWRDVKRREVIKKLQTFSQLLSEMIVHLKEHFISKKMTTFDNNVVQDSDEKIDGHFMKISEIAFNGLLDDKLEFLEHEFDCVEDLHVACEVGLLTREMTISKPYGTVRKAAKQESTFSFPHKLFQEYTAALYLQDLFSSKHAEFDKILQSAILPNPTRYKYLLYFTGSFKEAICKEILTTMINRKMYLDLIVEVAFEGQSEEAASVIDLMEPYLHQFLHIKKGTSMRLISGYMFTLKHLESVCLEVIPHRRVLSRNLAKELCLLQSLRRLVLIDCNVPVSFSSSLHKFSKDSKVEEFFLDRVMVTRKSSINLAKCICLLPRLEKFRFKILKECIHEDFFSALQSQASQSKVGSLELTEGNNESASQNLGASLCTMPCLKDIKVKGNLSDEFYCAFREGASSTSMVESLELHLNDISVDGSRNLGANICAMPCLSIVNVKSPFEAEAKVTLQKVRGGSSSSSSSSEGILSCQINLKLKEEQLIALLTSLASSALSQTPSVHIKSLQIDDHDISESVSETLGAGIRDMMYLKYLKLRGELSDGFFNKLKEGASSLKITEMHIMGATLNIRHLSTIALMPDLKSLCLFDIKIIDRTNNEEQGRSPSNTPAHASWTELIVDHDSFISLCDIGLLREILLVQLRRMTLAFTISNIPCLQQILLLEEIPCVTDLSLHGFDSWCTTQNVDLVQVIHKFPSLTNLKLFNIGNVNCTTILNSLKNIETLQTISLNNCRTSTSLDPLCNQINAEGKMTVTVNHGGCEWLELSDLFKRL